VISSWLTRPIERLARAARSMTAAGLGESIGLGPAPNDELGDLSKAFSAMSARLKEQVAELTKVTAQREAVESELRVAREIQLALMPSVAEFVDAQRGFELWAESVPARQVGGDFFDLIPLADGSAVFVIADVSGKGVPAAIYMAVKCSRARAGCSSSRTSSRCS
jgi:sigma-B regulation protein RsbU (phosphoserine phosphatase)